MRALKVTWAGCAVALVLMLSGCTNYTLAPADPGEEVVLPNPSIQPPSAPFGDSKADTTRRAVVYHVGADRQQLTPILRTLRTAGDEQMIEKAVSRVLERTDIEGAANIVPEGTFLKWLECSQNLVTVNLSADALNTTAQQLVWLRAAIANTVCEFEGIDYVSVLIDGQEVSAYSLPYGVMEKGDGNLTALWAQLEADEKRFQEDAAASQIDRKAALYFAAWTGNKLLPEVRTLHIDSQDLVGTLIKAISDGPMNTPEAHGVLPKSAALETRSEIVAGEDGRRIVRLNFPPGISADMEREGLTMGQLAASLTLTITRFLPEIDGVALFIDGTPVPSLTWGLKEFSLEGGVVVPELFSDSVGRVAKLYFSGKEGGLVSIERVLDQFGAVSPRILLEQLIEGPYVFDQDAQAVVPEGIASADMLGIRIEDDVALVNLSANFYRCCQRLDQEQERNLVYAIVNTLTGLPDVGKVRFFFEGEVAETLASSICLESALMANPGLVKD